MKKWEYCFVLPYDNEEEIFLKKLNELGANGWRIVTCDPVPALGVLMEREIPEPLSVSADIDAEGFPIRRQAPRQP